MGKGAAGREKDEEERKGEGEKETCDGVCRWLLEMVAVGRDGVGVGNEMVVMMVVMLVVEDGRCDMVGMVKNLQ